jgi:hypothetical protein
MTTGLQALWSQNGTHLIETQTVVRSHPVLGRLDALTEDTLTAEDARELEDRLQNPPLLPGRPARRVRVGDGQFLFQPA